MPIGPYPDFASCQSAMSGKYGAEGAKKVCGAMEARMNAKSEQGHEFTDLPIDAQVLWMDTFAESLEKNDEEGATKIAWANVYRRWEKSPSGQWHPFKTLDEITFKSLIKSDRVIFGAASVAIVDSENDLITEAALKSAFNSYITRGQVLFYHKNIPIGEVLPSYLAPDGKTYKSGVSDGKLDIVVRIYKDTQIANEVWNAIEQGQLRAFSIGGQILGDTVKICQSQDCSQFYNRVDQMDLHEISVVPNPANDASFFNIIKSKVQPMTVESTGIIRPTEKAISNDPEAFAIKNRTVAHAKAFGLAKSDSEATEQIRDWLKHPFSKYHISKLMALEKLVDDEKMKALNCPAFTEKAMKIISGEEDTMPDAFIGVLSNRMDKLTDGMEKLLQLAERNLSDSKRIDKLAEGMEKLFEMFTIKVVTK